MTEITIISLGAGVQSSALAVLAALGQVAPRPDAAVFADTGAEWPETYSFLWGHLAPFLAEHGLPLVVVRSRYGNLYDYLYERSLLPVVFGGKGVSRRQCTVKFKIDPIKQWLRQSGAKKATVLLGITQDENWRVKPSPDRWIENQYPLLDMGWQRMDCLRFLQDLGFPEPPKSRCWFCPMQTLSAWQNLASRHSDLFAKAIELEERAIARRIGVGKPPLTLTGVAPLRTLFSVSQPTLL